MKLLPKRPSARGPADWFTGDVYGPETEWGEHVTDGEYAAR